MGDFFCFLRVLGAGLKFDDFLGVPWGDQDREDTPGGANGLVPGPSKTVTRNQIADLQTAKSRYQTGKLPTADSRTRKNWKT